ncbi:MAG: hypothetical protein QG670_1853 [Thermoproteota archaeon]|nr:hypothetical protein [Thermoproteota archaeon]
MEDKKPNESANSGKDDDGDLHLPKPLYLRQIVGNFGNGVSGPYLPVYAIQLGASPTDLGWLRSLNNLFSNVMQIPWGVLSDNFGKRVLFIVASSLLSTLIWVLMLFVGTPWQLIGLVAVQAFVNSMVAPAWASLVGAIVPSLKRGFITASLNAAASLGSLTATIISGIIMYRSGVIGSQMYIIPFLMASASGFAAALTMLTIHERKGGMKRALTLRSWIDWRAMKENAYFRSFSTISVIHGFFMAMAWPLFTMTIVKVVKADMLQVAYIAVISGSASILVRRFVGHLSDRAGRKSLLVIGRAGIAFYALMYAFATSIYHLFAAEVFIGILGAVGDIVVFAYLLDVTEEDQRGTAFAIFNTLNGVATFFGSLCGGYFVSFFIVMGYTELVAIQLAYIISAVGRLGGGLLFMRIKEPYNYPSTVSKEIKQMINEDVDKTRARIERVEKDGEKIDGELEKDFEWLERRLRGKDKEEK